MVLILPILSNFQPSEDPQTCLEKLRPCKFDTTHGHLPSLLLKISSISKPQINSPVDDWVMWGGGGGVR